MKQLLKAFIGAVVPFFLHLCSFGQPTENLNYDSLSKDLLTITMQKLRGEGPRGNLFVTTGSKENDPPELKSLIPEVRGIPDKLKRTSEYFILLNYFQFHFQGYTAGKISKEFFIEHATNAKLDLNDTLLLSRKPIRCGVQVLTGLNSQDEPVIVVDVNGNNDFSDEPIRPLLPTATAATGGIPIPIPVDFSEKGKIVKDTMDIIFSSIAKDDSGNPLLSLAYPQFFFRKISVKGTPYYICSQVFPGERQKTIYIIPERPYFAGLPRDKAYNIGDKINLRGAELTYKGSMGDGRLIRLGGSNIASILRLDSTWFNYDDEPFPDIHSTRIRNQVGYQAPSIDGTNVVDSKKISSDSLRGKWLYVDFWSTTCAPCIAELPNLKAIYENMDRSKIEFIGVVEEYGEGSVDRLMQEHKIPWPTLKTGSGTKTDGYEIYSYPTTVLINPEGRIVRKDIRSDELSAILENLDTLNSR
ncbi:TlpA family protein disulfide reductase [Olivibacter sp. SA151]|uniref:TlpA family protein disulfide reductase n=1 Tax=Olivibacter jilunii TaxID=985016 RepID=UPI003F145283